MTLIDATKTCFRKYITFSGRASRPEFWKFMLFLFLVSLALTVLNSLIFGPTVTEEVRVSIDANGEQTQSTLQSMQYDGGIFGTIFGLATLLPALAAGWRRLHDTGRRGIFMLLPLAGLALMAAILLATAQSLAVDTSALSSGTGIPNEMPVPLSPGLFFVSWLVGFGSFILLFVWLCRASQPGSNTYGPNPNEVSP